MRMMNTEGLAKVFYAMSAGCWVRSEALMEENKERKGKHDISISEAKLREAEDYLKGYMMNRKLFRLEGYEKKRGICSEWDEVLPGELPLARARMFEVRHAIMSMPNGDEKLFLYYRYIKGETVERCGELLGVSRAGAFRLRRRAIELFAAHRDNMFEGIYSL